MRRAAVLLLALPAVAACGRGVDVPPPPYADSPACAELRLPDTILGAGRRPTDLPGTAAWGEPPITLRCGVERPQALTPDANVVDINGVTWLPIDGTGGTAFVTVDWPTPENPVYLEVLVPEDYAPEAGALVDLAPALG